MGNNLSINQILCWLFALVTGGILYVDFTSLGVPVIVAIPVVCLLIPNLYYVFREFKVNRKRK